MFLTKFEELVYGPQVTDDFTFSFAASDETYRDVEVEYVYDNYLALIPELFVFLLRAGWPLLLCCGVLLGLAFGVVYWRRRLARP
jgi:hypothetical protein